MLSNRLQFVQQAARRLSISAKDGSGKVSTLAVKVHGGARYADKEGVAHLLSRFNFHNTGNKSALRLVRESELLGGKFESTVDREYITLKATFLKEDLPYFVNALGNVLYKTSFRPHELPESVLPAAKYDVALAEANPVNKAEELLYDVVFRKDLGKPVLYNGVENVTLEDIKAYADKVYTKENIEIIGEGVNEADLKRFVNDSLINSLPTGSKLASQAQPKFFSGEARVRAPGASVAAITVPVTKEELATYEVLAKYVTSSLFELAPLVDSAKLDKYANAGLFALYVKGEDAAVVGENIKKVVAALKKDVDLSVAKEYAALQLALENASADVSNVKSVKLGKFSYAAVGNVAKLPFADEL
ncbi:ubiquinol-cytochrome c reductase core subunit 1 [Kluyveromyces marxianus]|nr:ubiquinol-cytochrome c reductase core subunit 1 [Kluyveromyces marxianus]KAG0684827.1 ubiquinol-cytochrome c reductase core subunit 1 [Kluyveromyces marxianus]